MMIKPSAPAGADMISRPLPPPPGVPMGLCGGWQWHLPGEDPQV